MFRFSGILCLAIAVLSGGLLFKTSQSVQRAEQALFQVNSKVEVERESLRILTAEWDYLNRPERLEKLTLQNLGMDEVGTEKTNFIEGDGSVPEPAIPVIPQVKPQYISIQGQGSLAKVEEKTIQNTENQNFSEIVGGQE